ncbi:MAG: phenylalanine--tRNA ligase subunit alpha [Bacteroidota bacterium]|jgi:phenylalanyl-tRNA synthetase alpha chain
MNSFAVRMEQRIASIREQLAQLTVAENIRAEEFRLKFLSKKGLLQQEIDAFKHLPPDEKKLLGKSLNDLKRAAEEFYARLKEQDSGEKQTDPSNAFHLPVYLNEPGGKHPINLIRDELAGIFHKLGFELVEGPEIEDEWHNFGALNFAENHPARDMQDTFFAGTSVLRTHTSSVQIREMERRIPPMRLMMPGRVFRNEAVSARSNCFFHQLEGLYIDKDVSFGDLKQTLYYFIQELFGENTRVRFRPSYFPFTEPSAELDVWVGTETDDDYRLTKGTGWLEILGCGMVHPNVLKNVNIDPEIYSGFAFGLGLDRICMLRYGVKDIRDFFTGDIRFLSQFASF